MILKKSLSICFLFASLVSACSSSTPDAESSHGSSNIATSEKDNVITATIKKDLNFSQIVFASSTSDVAESSIGFPVGALAVDTEIKLGQAADSLKGIMAAVGGSAKSVKSGPALYVGPSSGKDVATKDALDLSLPLPISTSDFGLASKGKLAFAYLVYTSKGWIAGLKPLTVDNLVGTFVRVKVKGFGYFQIVYLTESIEAKEESTTVTPLLEISLGSFGCLKETKLVCQYFGSKNAGKVSDKTTECKKSGVVVKDCPEADFISSCYYKSNDLKYYFYKGHESANESDCDGGTYSEDYSTAN